MISSWILGVARLTPVLIVVSIGLISYGGIRLYYYMQKRKQDIAEEEQKRQEFLKKMKFTPKKDPLT